MFNAIEFFRSPRQVLQAQSAAQICCPAKIGMIMIGRPSRSFCISLQLPGHLYQLHWARCHILEPSVYLMLTGDKVMPCPKL
jgi:hypothetical protein